MSPSESCPTIEATIARAELVKRWLEAAARCEWPKLDERCLFDASELSAASVGNRLVPIALVPETAAACGP